MALENDEKLIAHGACVCNCNLRTTKKREFRTHPKYGQLIQSQIIFVVGKSSFHL